MVIVLVTLISNFSMSFWINNAANNSENNDANDQTVSTTGTIHVRGLEIFGGDIKSESGKVYIDWGELSPGSSKNASFYLQSTSNVDVELGLNVTGWKPTGIENYLDISWDYNGTLLSPDHKPLLVTVNLEVSSSRDFIDYLLENNVTSFGFDLTMYASGV
jgi:hypothetical protein